MLKSLKKSLKKIVLLVFGAMLIANAGYDFSRWVRKHAAEKLALRAMVKVFDVEGGGGLVPKINDCHPAKNVGWVCDFTLTAPDGQVARGGHIFTNEELSNG